MMQTQKMIIVDNIQINIQQPSSQVHHQLKHQRLQYLQLLQKVAILQLKLQRLQKKHSQMKEKQQHTIKKNRRRNNEIIKAFKCQHVQCQRLYGSVTSLKLHMANKHGMQSRKRIVKNKTQRLE